MVKMRTKKEMLREWVKPLRDSVQLRGGRWSSHRKRNVSGQENRTHNNQGTQWGVTVLCKQGGKGSALQQWEPCCGSGDHRNAPGGREKLRKTAGITLEEQAASKLLLALHFPTSSFLHQAQQPPAPPALRAPANAPLGQQITRAPSNPTGRNPGLSLS